MENTQSNQQPTDQQTAVNTPGAQTGTQQQEPKNKPPFFLFLLIGLIIIFGAAIFVIQNKDLLGLPLNQTNNQASTQVNPTAAINTAASPTAPITSSPEEQEVESVNIDESIDADFQPVEQDLQELQGS